MRIGKQYLAFLTGFLVVLTPIPTYAWNYAGHRVRVDRLPPTRRSDQAEDRRGLEEAPCLC